MAGDATEFLVGSARRALRAVRLPGALLSAALLGLLFVACWLIAVQGGTETSVARHWFYVPIVLSAFRFGPVGGVGGAVAAGLLAGPLVIGTSPEPAGWLLRMAFYLLIGLLVGVGSSLGLQTFDKELEIADRERALFEQQMALVQAVSHEFRTPLTVIQGIGQTFQQRPELVAERARTLIPGLTRATSRLSDMITIVLAAGEVLDVDLRQRQEAVDIPDLVSAVADDLVALGGPKRVLVVVEEGSRVTHTVPSYLRVALRAVVENALKFSPDDQPVVVQVKQRDPNALHIRVRDRGPGFDPDFLEHALKPFTQSDSSARRPHGGLGIGLFATSRILKSLGGEIVLANNADDGATVHLSIPQRRDTDRRRHRRPRRPHDVTVVATSDEPRAATDAPPAAADEPPDAASA